MFSLGLNNNHVPPALEINASRQFTNWMLEQKLSLGFTTYQAGKLFLLGLQPNGRLSVFERTFNRCLGLCGDGQNTLDVLFVPIVALRKCAFTWSIGLGLRSLVCSSGRVYDRRLGHTRCGGGEQWTSCLRCSVASATISDTHSFVPLWKPPFISKLAAEDRCHLNGLALERGQAKYVTAVSQSDVADGWRDRRHDGGCVIDVPSNDVIASGLSMPHSPRQLIATSYGC